MADAVQEEQHEAYEECCEAEGGNLYQERRVLQHAEDDCHHCEESLHDVPLRLWVVRHNRQSYHKVRHDDHRANARAIQRHEQRKVE